MFSTLQSGCFLVTSGALSQFEKSHKLWKSGFALRLLGSAQISGCIFGSGSSGLVPTLSVVSIHLHTNSGVVRTYGGPTTGLCGGGHLTLA